MKNLSIFAAYTPSTTFYCNSEVAIFMAIWLLSANDIRLSIHNGLLRLRCDLYLAVRGAIAFLISNTLIFHDMPSTMKEASKGKNSTRTREPNRAISVSIPLTELLEVYQDFKIEMNEKNKAYAFILSMGLGDKYKEFSDSLPTAVDTHELCTKLLSTENL